MKVVVIPDEAKKDAMEVGWQVLKWLTDHQIPAVLSPPVNALAEGKFDMAILLGGDGFINEKNFWLARINVPFIGINFGQKGCLAVAEKDNWQEVLEKVIAGRYEIKSQPVLKVKFLRQDNTESSHEAVGDTYIRHRNCMMRARVMVDGEIVYEGIGSDGVVITASMAVSAYNISNGGPIFDTGFMITFIAAHVMGPKPFRAVNESQTIEIIYEGPWSKGHESDDEGCLFFIDGRKIGEIQRGERILIAKSCREVLFVIPEGFNLFDSISKKLTPPENLGFQDKEEAQE